MDQTLQPALQRRAAKQEGRCGRIVLVLHCIQAAAPQTPPAHSSAAKPCQGHRDLRLYEQQLRRFYKLALANTGDSLEGNTLLVFGHQKRWRQVLHSPRDQQRSKEIASNDRSANTQQLRC